MKTCPDGDEVDPLPTTKDCVLMELARRRSAIPETELEHARAIQEEMSRAGIQRPLASLLTERKLAPKEVVQGLLDEANRHQIRCKECGKPTSVSLAEVNGGLSCKHCKKPIEHTSYARIADTDLQSTGRGEGRAAAQQVAAASPAGTPPAAQESSPSRSPETGIQGTAASAGGEPAAKPAGASRPRARPQGFELSAQAELGPLQDIKKFRTRRLLGLSPFGRLYLVEDGARASAIKVLDRDLAVDKVRVKKWSDYMSHATDLSRSATLKPVQLFREGSATYLLRPYLGNSDDSLRARLLCRDPALLTAAGARAAFEAIAQSLGEFHDAGIPHGNLRPENVLWIGENACLSDPGLQLLLEGLPPEDRGLRLSEQSRWFAPEVLLGGEATLVSDVFSLGRILEDLLQAAEAAGQRSPTSSRDPAWTVLEALARRLTAPAPEDRPATARAALEALGARKSLGLQSAGKRWRLDGRTLLRALKRTRLQTAGHAALLLAGLVVSFQAVGWYRERNAFASPTRFDAATAEIVERKISDLVRESRDPGLSRTDVEAHWAALELSLRGTPFEKAASEARKAAQPEVLRKPEPGEQHLAAARNHVKSRQWAEALRELLLVGPALEQVEEGRALRTQALEGLLKDDGMLLVPGPGGKAEGAFLIDARPLTKRTDDGAGPRRLGEAVVAATRLDYGEAHLKAAAQGKRLPTGSEWDQLFRLSTEARDPWVSGIPDQAIFVPGLFEWIADDADDELAREGYGWCRGGGRDGVPPTHPLRRKKAASYADVGLRCARDLIPGATR